MSPAELFQCYQRGWRIGATARAHDRRFQLHADPGVVTEYERGHRDGRDTWLLAGAKAADRLGYDPSMSILRSPDNFDGKGKVP